MCFFFPQACLDRNPVAFKPKIGKGKQGESDRRHSKGCNCKKSGCLKNYCECYEVSVFTGQRVVVPKLLWKNGSSVVMILF